MTPLYKVPRRYKLLSFYVGGFFLFILISLLPADRPICLFRNLTGLPCIGCGLTSGFHKILRLDFAGAWKNNILSIPFFLVLAGGFLWTLADCICKKNILPHLSVANWKTWQKLLFALAVSLLYMGAWAVNLLRWFHKVTF